MVYVKLAFAPSVEEAGFESESTIVRLVVEATLLICKLIAVEVAPGEKDAVPEANV